MFSQKKRIFELEERIQRLEKQVADLCKARKPEVLVVEPGRINPFFSILCTEPMIIGQEEIPLVEAVELMAKELGVTFKRTKAVQAVQAKWVAETQTVKPTKKAKQ